MSESTKLFEEWVENILRLVLRVQAGETLAPNELEEACKMRADLVNYEREQRQIARELHKPMPKQRRRII